jgi:hypothetical protein
LPIAFHLTGGEVSDSTQLEASLEIDPGITRGIAGGLKADEGGARSLKLLTGPLIAPPA